MNKGDLIKISDWLWEIPKDYRHDMRVPARIYASEKLLDEIFRDKSLDQLVNVAALPGIQKYAIAMPDAHEGYGFPVGGVAAFGIEDGVISPGGIGYDINCGVRLLKSERTYDQIRDTLKELGGVIYKEVPSGVGKSGRLVLKGNEFDAVLEKGAGKMVELGYGEPADLENIESNGRLEEAEPALVSERAKTRGRDQLGTMGAGNHFVEIEAVETVFDEAEAKKLGIFKDQVVVLIHTGSRGLGHQIATDYIRVMMKAMPKYGIKLPDRELACAPFRSPEGQDYFKAMSCGANFAWANRQLITWEVRKAWQDVLGNGAGELDVVHDVAHNIAKIEEYERNTNLPARNVTHSVAGGQIRASLAEDGESRRANAEFDSANATNQEKNRVVVHRKGATRAFPEQPVLIPGSMGTGSYLLVGTGQAMEESFGSSCHGAGRRMSRTQAKKQIQGSTLKKQLEERGIVINAGSMVGLAEEAPEAYKNVDAVVDVVHQAGIAKKVAKMRPMAVIKG